MERLMENRASGAKKTTTRLTLLAALTLLAGLPGAVQAQGPDVTVFDLSDTTNYGTSGGVRGYAIGTRSCNIGTKPLNWCDANGGCGDGTTNRDHPVIAQNIYRLKNGRLDQVGASWLKHGFLSTNSSTSGCLTGTCTQPPLGSDQLGVGCTDPYGSGLNGSRPMGRKSEVNPSTGDFPFPPTGGGSSAAVWNQRVAVAETDLDDTNNPGALYYLEGHYIAPDDAIAGNGLNNASYRRVTVNSSNFNLSMASATVRQKSAIEVWPLVDNTVELINVDAPTLPVERFHVARKVTDLGSGVWHYEYAIHNMNSARSADRLTITFGGSTAFSNVGFHDVNAHSGEPYDTTDWGTSTNATSITWQAAAFSPPEDANALRWATMYNFWFDANRGPSEISLHTLGLFETGSPTELEFLPGNPEALPLFEDGFETGDTAGWDQTLP